ncbi:MAG: hypothetical protein GY713_17265 [Actinomycetia bacterium]|nr:hypothetical protein [Actinomycetes bacterium]
MRAARWSVPLLASVLVVVEADPAYAHGTGGRSDLPLPLWLFTYGAAAVLLVSFAALRAFWHRPHLRAAAAGRPVSALGVLAGVLRTIGLALWLLTALAVWIGASIAPTAIYILFWLGVPILSVFLGDVWRALNPLDTLAGLGERLGLVAERRDRTEAPVWIAGTMVFAFVWLKLAYHDPVSTDALRVWFTLHTVVALGGSALYGRDWLRDNEGFAVLYGLLGRLGPLFAREGRLRARWPLTGLTDALPAAAPAVILVTLGSATFDGFTRTDYWLDIVGNRTGWSQTLIGTLALVWLIGLIGVVWVLANHGVARITGRDRSEMIEAFMPSLVPIMLVYVVAHYFSSLLLRGQIFLTRLSDPFGRGWDLFGTVDNTVDHTVLSTDTIAYLQAGAILIGHIWAVLVTHDRALELFEREEVERSQYPILAVMVIFVVGGMAILLGS